MSKEEFYNYGESLGISINDLQRLKMLAVADKKYTEEDINEMACDFVINVGGLPKTIEEWQNALWKFYQSLNKKD